MTSSTNPVLERRRAAQPIEIREAGDGLVELTGYASTFNQPYDMGHYSEVVSRGAFQRTLGTQPDVRLLVNHDGLPLARTSSGTLHLEEDGHGLRVRAQLDPTDPDVAAILPKIRRGDLNQMSFGFRIDPDGQAWDGDLRTLRSLDLNDGDVSLVTFPANPNTTATARGRANQTPPSPAADALAAIRRLQRVENPFLTEEAFRYDDEARSAWESFMAEVEQRFHPVTVADQRTAMAKLMAEVTVERRSAAKAESQREARRYAERAAEDAAKLADLWFDEAERIPSRDVPLAELTNPRSQGATMTTETIHDDRPIYSQLLTRSIEKAPTLSPAYAEPVGATYRRDNARQVSFFRDLHAARRGDYQALERLHRHSLERAAETRAGDMTTANNAGGQFAPPLWLVEDYVKLARAGRVTANVLRHQSLPSGISSINIPTVATGTSTAVQATQNTAVSDTAMTTGVVSAPISTIAGKQVISLQLMEQSGIPFDEVVLGDLAADAARTLDTQVISGSGSSGQLTGLLTSGTTLTYTQASPTFQTFVSAISKAVNAVNIGRYLPPSVLVLHPTRWSWILEQLDSQNRPLVVPDANGAAAVNAFGTASAIGAQDAVGKLAGLPVFTDPNIPTNLGAGTNQDVAFVMRAEDVWLYEGEPRMESFDATYADQLSLLLRVYQYAVSPLVRHPQSVQVISGTGMVVPAL